MIIFCQRDSTCIYSILHMDTVLNTNWCEILSIDKNVIFPVTIQVIEMVLWDHSSKDASRIPRPGKAFLGAMILDWEWNFMLQLGCDEVTRERLGIWRKMSRLWPFLVEPLLALQVCSLQLAMFQHKVTRWYSLSDLRHEQPAIITAYCKPTTVLATSNAAWCNICCHYLFLQEASARILCTWTIHAKGAVELVYFWILFGLYTVCTELLLGSLKLFASRRYYYYTLWHHLCLWHDHASYGCNKACMLSSCSLSLMEKGNLTYIIWQVKHRSG